MPRTPLGEADLGLLRRLNSYGSRVAIPGVAGEILGDLRSLETRGLLKIDGDVFSVTPKGTRLLSGSTPKRPGRPPRRREDTLHLAAYEGEKARADAAWNGESEQAQRQAYNAAAKARLQAADPRRRVTTEGARSELAYHGVHGPEFTTPDRIGDYLRMIARNPTVATAKDVARQWARFVESMRGQADPAREATAKRAIEGAVRHLRDTLARGESASSALVVDPSRLPMLNEAFALLASKLLRIERRRAWRQSRKALHAE